MNIIDAIIRLVENPVTNIKEYKIGNNRANNAGVALEEYVKDLFAGSFGLGEAERAEKLSNAFSYLGNNSNPPDAMLKGGDAIEIKKIETAGGALALNSSYPKHTLKSTSNMISGACRKAEAGWEEKDMIYIVGVVPKNAKNLTKMCMVYGMDYCASEECYAGLKAKIKEGVENIPGIDFEETAEIGHINRVDPLGITYMRVRGMWGIDNPWKAFSYVFKTNKEHAFEFMCIINYEKWETLKNRDMLKSVNVQKGTFNVSDIRIKNPDNPAILNGAKLITYIITAEDAKKRRGRSSN